MKSEKIRKAGKGFAVGALVLMMLCASCRTKSAVQVQQVGPPLFGASLGRINPNEVGFLIVYSATSDRSLSGKKISQPHTGYLIRKADGSKYEWIDNALDATDELPTLVALPGGSYKVVAQDNHYNEVIVPVLIEPWRTTRVYLDTHSSKVFSGITSTNLVHLPDDRIVGWRAGPES